MKRTALQKRHKKTVIYQIPKLYWHTLVLSAILFGLALLTVYYADEHASTDPFVAVPQEYNFSLEIPEHPGLATNESWGLLDEPILTGVQNVSALTYADGTIALYYVQDGIVYRRTSQNGLAFTDPVKTGIEEDVTIPFDRRPEIHNPAVLQISSEYFIMVYELSPRQKPEVPQRDQPRALHTAFSSDGLTFTPHGKIVDGARNDAGLIDGPDLLLLPSGDLRLFYESQDDRIVSMLSENNGQDWIWEGERVQRVAQDPAVYFNGEGYALYYTGEYKAISEQGELVQTRAVFRAYSSEGIDFTKNNNPVLVAQGFRSVQHPEIILQTDGTMRMYVNVLRPGTADAYDLYAAVLRQE